MQYTQLFKSLREAKGVSAEELARRARKHRNTVLNVESGRPVRFRTIADLMIKMGYPAGSREMRNVALLWLEHISKINLGEGDVEVSARKSLTSLRSPIRVAAKRLEEEIVRAGLNQSQINLLLFAVQQLEMLKIMNSIRDLATTFAPAEVQELKAAEDR